METRYDIISRRTGEDGVALRGVSRNGLPAGAELTSSTTLEEGYLAIMARRGRSAAAQQDENA